jgi:hypothetical protein
MFEQTIKNELKINRNLSQIEQRDMFGMDIRCLKDIWNQLPIGSCTIKQFLLTYHFLKKYPTEIEGNSMESINQHL